MIGSATVIVTASPDELAWCCQLAGTLSLCCISPTRERVVEVAQLLDVPPLTMLPMAWHSLIEAAEAWLHSPAGTPFTGQRQIEAALADKPVPVPAWAERYQ